MNARSRHLFGVAAGIPALCRSDNRTVAANARPVIKAFYLGTMDAEHGCWVVVRTHDRDKCHFPKDVRPILDIEFAPKTPGGKSVKRRYELTGFC